MSSSLFLDVLTLLAQNGYIDVVVPLLTLSKDVYGDQQLYAALQHLESTRYGRTRVMYQSYLGNAERVLWLLCNGGRVQSRTKEGLDALFFGCLGGSTPTIKVLLSKGACINGQETGSVECTPLFAAVTSGGVGAVRVLLREGVNLWRRGGLNDTAYSLGGFLLPPPSVLEYSLVPSHQGAPIPPLNVLQELLSAGGTLTPPSGDILLPIEYPMNPRLSFHQAMPTRVLETLGECPDRLRAVLRSIGTTTVLHYAITSRLTLPFLGGALFYACHACEPSGVREVLKYCARHLPPDQPLSYFLGDFECFRYAALRTAATTINPALVSKAVAVLGELRAGGLFPFPSPSPSSPYGAADLHSGMHWEWAIAVDSSGGGSGGSVFLPPQGSPPLFIAMAAESQGWAPGLTRGMVNALKAPLASTASDSGSGSGSGNSSGGMGGVSALAFAVLLGDPEMVEFFAEVAGGGAAGCGKNESKGVVGGGGKWREFATALLPRPVAMAVVNSHAMEVGDGRSLLHWASISIRTPSQRVRILRALASTRDANPVEALHAAAETGYVDLVCELIEVRGSVEVDAVLDHPHQSGAGSGGGGGNGVNSHCYAWTALMHAAGGGGGGGGGGDIKGGEVGEEGGGCLAVLHELLRLGADCMYEAPPPPKSPHITRGMSPLSVACDTGNVRGVEALLEGGAVAGPRDLIWACRRGHVGVIKVLLGKRMGGGVSVHSRDEEKGGGGRTALMCAAEAGHGEAVKLLLAAGADPEARGLGNPGKTARQLAEANGKAHIVDLFKR